MNRLICLTLAAALAVVGCRTADKPDRTDAPPPATKPAKQAGADDNLTDEDLAAQWRQGVTKVVAKPTLTTKPTTQPVAGAPRVANPTAAADNMPAPTFTLDDLQRVDTSVSTAPLVRLLVMKLNAIPYLRFAGYGTLDFVPELPEGTEPDRMTSDILSREPAGTTKALERLMKGEVDMVFLSRKPTDQELAAAEKKNIRLRTDLIATEALIFTVNIDNPVNNVTRQNLQDLFSGKARTWAGMDIKGFPLTHPIADKKVTVAYRARGLGTEELMEQLLLDGKELPEMPVSAALSSTKLVLDATAEDPQTLGFSVFCYISNMERQGQIKVLAVDGVLPEPSRVASGEYPLTTPIYLVSRATLDPESNLVALRKWLLAMPGQKLLAEAGYMPIIPEAWTQQRLIDD